MTSNIQKPIDYSKLATPFDKSDWEWRVERVGITNGKPWCNIVPYIQNRAIQDRLDEVCEPQNWKNEFKPWKDNAQLCGISIYDPQKCEWVTKWDGADDTNFESTKGGISASMKRAAVQWGIGRHLYDQNGVYVECSLERTRGWEKATTKDKKVVYWNPNDPQLIGSSRTKQKSQTKQKPSAKDNPTEAKTNGEPAEFVVQLEAEKELLAVTGIDRKTIAPVFQARYGVKLDDAPASLIHKAIKDFKARQKELGK